MDRFPRGFSSIEEGQAFVKKLQALRLSPATLRSALQAESNEIEKKVGKRPRSPSKPKISTDDVLKGLI
jgi:hypothetical protein